MINKKHLTRQQDIIHPRVLGRPITIIGAGAIGSFVALSLAKMGCRKMTIYDFDKVDEENMCCSFYNPNSIGKPKVIALLEMLESVAPENNFIYKQEKYEGGGLNGIIISAVDSMAVRKNIWENQKGNMNAGFIIDPRMGAETMTIIAMNPNDEKDRESYIKMWHTDEKSLWEPCTAKSTIYTTNIIAGLVCKLVKDLLTDQPYSRISKFDVKNWDAEFYKVKHDS